MSTTHCMCVVVMIERRQKELPRQMFSASQVQRLLEIIQSANIFGLQ